MGWFSFLKKEPKSLVSKDAVEAIRGGLEELFSAPFDVDEINNGFGEEHEYYQIASREVLTSQGSCGAGHVHRQIILQEVFKPAAKGDAPEAAGIKTTSEAIEEFTSKLKENPKKAVEYAGVESHGGGYAKTKDDEIVRVFELKDVFDTKASLKNEAMQEDQIMQAVFASMMGGAKGVVVTAGPNGVEMTEIGGGFDDEQSNDNKRDPDDFDDFEDVTDEQDPKTPRLGG